MNNEWKNILNWGENELDELRCSGYSFIRQSHYRMAILFFEALIIIDSYNVYDYQILGALYLQVGENEKALLTLDKALRLQGDHLPTLINKTKALFCLKKTKEAIPLAQYLTTCSDPIIANDAEALLMCYTHQHKSSSQNVANVTN